MTTQAAAPPLTLKYAKTIGIVNNGFNGRGFAYPYDLAVSADGRIFVLKPVGKGPARRHMQPGRGLRRRVRRGIRQGRGTVHASGIRRVRQRGAPLRQRRVPEQGLHIQYGRRAARDVGRGGLRRRRAQRPVGA